MKTKANTLFDFVESIVAFNGEMEIVYDEFHYSKIIKTEDRETYSLSYNGIFCAFINYDKDDHSVTITVNRSSNKENFKDVILLMSSLVHRLYVNILSDKIKSYSVRYYDKV